MTEEKTVAIACQGGGSHCAFGAGVLIEMLERLLERGALARHGGTYRVMGFSGTSGGAVNALLTWLGFVSPAGLRAGVEALEGFWRDVMAVAPLDAVANATVVNMTRLQGVVPMVEVAPSLQFDWGQQRLRAVLERHVPFARLHELVHTDSPQLYIGAANIVSGAFTVFGGAGRHSTVTVEQVLASAAVPELFPPVKIDDNFYWDGLLSQNPPIRNFMRGRTRDSIPDEIWIIRINPIAHSPVPAQLADIRDRRNEMAGNLALEEERYFIQQVNNWVRRGLLPEKKHVAVHEISLERAVHGEDGLDYASKLDRNPVFIESLMMRGRKAAERFFSASA